MMLAGGGTYYNITNAPVVSWYLADAVQCDAFIPSPPTIFAVPYRARLCGH
jgi:hypothetical protein